MKANRMQIKGKLSFLLLTKYLVYHNVYHTHGAKTDGISSREGDTERADHKIDLIGMEEIIKNQLLRLSKFLNIEINMGSGLPYEPSSVTSSKD